MRVVAFHISDAIEAPDVSVRVVYDQIILGRDSIAEASEVEAFVTTVFVFESIEETAEAT